MITKKETNIPATPVPISGKAQPKPIKTKPVQAPAIALEVKGKEAPIQETPVPVRKEVKCPTPTPGGVIIQAPGKMDEFYKDWREKVSEL